MNNPQEPTKIKDIIIKRRNKVALRDGYIQLFVRLILMIAVGYIIFTQVFLITRVTGNGMFPAVKDGDLAIAFRIHNDYLKNDVISYKTENTRHIGRVIGKEGDVITIDDSGTLLVNGTVQGGEILYPTYAKEKLEYPYRVPEETMFVLGDYRTQTKDSRDFGPIAEDDVEGKLITILRRRGL